MARQRSPDSIKAEKMYIESNGAIELIDIAKSLDVSDGTVRSWKNRYKWDELLNATLQMGKRNVANKKVNKIVKKEEPEVEKFPVVDNPELTEKQRLFCIYYIKYFNATKAAIKAGYSAETAYSIGSENLRKPEIEKEIQRLKDSKFKGAFLDKEDLLQKYIDIAFSDITDYVEFGQEEVPVVGAFGPVKDEDGEPLTKIVNVVKFKNSAVVDGTIISEVKQGKDGASIKLQDKMKALDFLAKHIGLLDIETQHKLKIEDEKVKVLKDKLALEKEKVNKDNGTLTDQVIIVEDLEE